MQGFLLAILVLSIIIPIGVNHAFGELIVVQTESQVKVTQQNWYDDSWEFRKNIKLSLNTATGVDSDLTDFPSLISFTHTHTNTHTQTERQSIKHTHTHSHT